MEEAVSLLGTIFILLILMMVIRILIKKRNTTSKREEYREPTSFFGKVIHKNSRMFTIIGILFMVAIVVLLSCLEIVDVAHVGVVYNKKGGIEKKVLPQGYYFVSPMKTVVDYPVSVRTVAMTQDNRTASQGDDSFEANTKDGKSVLVGVEMNYKLDKDKVAKIYDDFGKKSPQEIEDYHIKGRMRAISREVISKHTVLELLGDGRGAIEDEMEKIITETLGKDGMEVKFFNLEETIADQATLDAIQKRTDTRIQLETVKDERKVEEIKEGTALMKAKKRAETRKVEAEGAKNANELLNQSLSDKVLQKQWIEKWDGKLPTVSGQDSTIVNLPTGK